MVLPSSPAAGYLISFIKMRTSSSNFAICAHGEAGIDACCVNVLNHADGSGLGRLVYALVGVPAHHGESSALEMLFHSQTHARPVLLVFDWPCFSYTGPPSVAEVAGSGGPPIGLRQQRYFDDQLKRGSDEMHTCQSHLDEHSGRRTVRGPSAGKIADRLC